MKVVENYLKTEVNPLGVGYFVLIALTVWLKQI